MLEKCGGLERTDFLYIYNWLNGLIIYSFYFGRVWWSWRNCYLTVSILKECSGLEGTDFFTISMIEECGGLERTDFYIYIIDSMDWFFYSFYFERVWWSWKNWFFTISMREECGGLERTDFLQFPCWKGVVVLKELIFNSFYFGRVWWSWQNWFFTISFFGWMWWSWKNWFLTVSSLGGCGGLKRTDFYIYIIVSMDWFFTVSTLRGCGGLERTDFLQFLLCEVVVALKELIFNSFYVGRVWWSSKN